MCIRDRANPQPKETALVIGAGPIGLAALEFLRLHDLNIIVMDMVESRLEFCRDHLGIQHTVVFRADGNHLSELEAITGGELANIVIDASGSVRSMSSCFEYAAFTGRVIYVGITTENLSFPHAPVFHRRELTLLASRNALPDDFGKIIDLIAAGEINTDVWITDRLSFGDVPSDFAAFTDTGRGTVKALIEIP